MLAHDKRHGHARALLEFITKVFLDRRPHRFVGAIHLLHGLGSFIIEVAQVSIRILALAADRDGHQILVRAHLTMVLPGGHMYGNDP